MSTTKVLTIVIPTIEQLEQEKLEAIEQLVDNLIDCMVAAKVKDYLVRFPSIDYYDPTTAFSYNGNKFYFGRNQYKGEWVELNKQCMITFFCKSTIADVLLYADEILASIDLLHLKVEKYLTHIQTIKAKSETIKP